MAMVKICEVSRALSLDLRKFMLNAFQKAPVLTSGRKNDAW